MIIIFIVLFSVSLLMLYYFLRDQTLTRLFAFMMCSVLTYLSFELTLWSFRLPLPVMLVVGLIPICCVAYGFRVYDYHRQRESEKIKNDDKAKHEETIAA